MQRDGPLLGDQLLELVESVHAVELVHPLLLADLVDDCVFANVVYLGAVAVGEDLLVPQDQFLGEEE